MFKKKNTIKDCTFVTDRISEKTDKIVSKDLDKITLSEFSHLLKENIAIHFCLNLIISRIKSIKLDFEFFFNSKESEEQREILRELVLINSNNWNINPKAYELLKNILSKNISSLKLPEFITERFLNYKPKELIWNEKSIEEFNSFMNDTRMGVWYAYNMLILHKRAILNGTNIIYKVGDEQIELKTLNEFEEKVLKNVKINNELDKLLENEKTNENHRL